MRYFFSEDSGAEGFVGYGDLRNIGDLERFMACAPESIDIERVAATPERKEATIHDATTPEMKTDIPPAADEFICSIAETCEDLTWSCPNCRVALISVLRVLHYHPLKKNYRGISIALK